MANTEAPDTEAAETLIEQIMELFQSNSASIDYGTDPNAWVEGHLPEGTEAADVARCLPEVSERLGSDYQANAVRYNVYHGVHGAPATHTVVNEISYTYNTINQQNTFIYAEDGAQVVNIQGDGNHVTQSQIDLDFDIDLDQYEDGYEDGEDYEGEETPVDEYDEPELPEEGDTDTDDSEDTDAEDGWEDPTPGEEVDPTTTYPVDPVDDGWPDPVDPVDPVDPIDPVDADPSAGIPDGAEAL